MYRSRLSAWNVRKNLFREEAIKIATDSVAAQDTCSTDLARLNQQRVHKYLRRNKLSHLLRCPNLPKSPPDCYTIRLSCHFLRTIGGWAAWCEESGTVEDIGRLTGVNWQRTISSSRWAFVAFEDGIEEVINLLDEGDTYHAYMILERAFDFWDDLVVTTHWTFFLQLFYLYNGLLARGLSQLRKKIAKAIVKKAWLGLPLRDPRLLIYRDLYQMAEDTLSGIYEHHATERCLTDSLSPLLGPDHQEILYLQDIQSRNMDARERVRRRDKAQRVTELYRYATQQANLTCLDELGFRDEQSALEACVWHLLTSEHYHKALRIARWMLAEMPKSESHPQDLEIYTYQAWYIIRSCTHQLGSIEEEIEAICRTMDCLRMSTQVHPFSTVRDVRQAVRCFQRLGATRHASTYEAWHAEILDNISNVKPPSQWEAQAYRVHKIK